MTLWQFSENGDELDCSNCKHFLQDVYGENPRFLSREPFDIFRNQWKKHEPSVLFGRPLGVIGLGGSSLGLKAVLGACWPEVLGKDVFFFDNIDPVSHYDQLQYLYKRGDVNWLVISKSGRTMETLTLLESIFNFYQNQDQSLHNESATERTHKFQDSVWFVSEDQTNPLSQLANRWRRPLFTIPKDLGGRFSVFSAVGLLPLSLLQLPIDSIIQGFCSGLENKDLILKLTSFFRPLDTNPTETLYFASYSDRFLHLGSWMNQLWSESLGKKQTLTGKMTTGVGPLVPFRGASDQHSILQQVLEGPFAKKVFVLRSQDSEQSSEFKGSGLFPELGYRSPSLGTLMKVEVEATLKTFKTLNIPSAYISTPKLTPEAMGNLMGSLMVTVATLAKVLDINAYNQPAVEIGKELARKKLSTLSIK